MPDWLSALLIGSGGGLVGYLLRGWIDDRFARAKEARALRQLDVRALRNGLHTFLGQPRAHFDRLESTANVDSAEAAPTPEERAMVIADWVYENAMKHPAERRGPMYLISNVAHQLAGGDRHFLDVNPIGYERIEDAWNSLDEYAQLLTRMLHDADNPGRGGITRRCRRTALRAAPERQVVRRLMAGAL